MSAIFGILNFDGAPVAPDDMERMASAQSHRAPGGCEIWIDGRIGLGRGLMQITREDAFDAQPLIDRNAGIALVADLRLDNRDDLARALGIDAPRLDAMPDSALLLHAYRKWGADCAQRLLGDFAFAIWNARERKLVLARDHLGQRSCFYHRADRFFAFATEIDGLWAHRDVPRTLSDGGIARLLMHEMSPRPGATLYDGIDGLPGAETLVVEARGGMVRRAYWQPRADPAHIGRDEEHYVEAYRAVLGEAVACRLRRTTAPAGILLSGGYDSAAVAALAGPMVTAQGRKLVAVCSAMPADYRGSVRHARKWVEMCRRDMAHLDVRYLTGEGINLLSEPDVLALRHDKAIGPYAGMTSRLYALAAGAGVRVMMDGSGGDQTLNPRGQTALARFLALGQFERFARELRGQRRMTGASVWRILASDVLGALLPPSFARLWRHARRGFSAAWRNQPVRDEFARRMIAEGKIEPRSVRGASRKGIDLQGHMLAAVMRRMGAARSTAGAAVRGLEPTQPFFDKRVVELALAIPFELHVKDGRNRYLACRALADLYPPEFQTRSRMNDDLIPDFQSMVKSVEPEILAEIARMEKSEALSRYVDFDKIRRLLAARGPDDHNSGWEQETQAAIGGLASARFIERFRGYN